MRLDWNFFLLRFFFCSVSRLIFCFYLQRDVFLHPYAATLGHPLGNSCLTFPPRTYHPWRRWRVKFTFTTFNLYAYRRSSVEGPSLLFFLPHNASSGSLPPPPPPPSKPVDHLIFQSYSIISTLLSVRYGIRYTGGKQKVKKTSRTEFGQQMRSLANCPRTCL